MEGQEADNMAANRKRLARQSHRKIAANITQEYLEGLEARDFLAECSNNVYHDALTDEETELLREYQSCDCDFKKWKEMKKRT